jgi:hypothetical protein
MGEAKLVSIEELKKDNPRLCLSALRVFNRCEECPIYDKCESRKVNPELIKKLERKEELKKQLKEIKEELKR